MDLENKVVFVTGSSQGIGRAVALEASDRGATVVLHYSRSAAKIEDVKREIEASGGKTAIVQGDWGDSPSVVRASEEAWSAFGRIDVLVNNAGVNLKKYFAETDEEELDWLYRVNVRGTYLCTRTILPKMIEAGVRGRILTVTSINAVRSGEGFSLYGGSKAWLEMMMKNLALESAEHGILVNTIPVGAVKTGMTGTIQVDPKLTELVNSGIPLNRMGEPEEIARTICALAGSAGDYMTGSSIVIDGGLALKRGIGNTLSRNGLKEEK